MSTSYRAALIASKAYYQPTPEQRQELFVRGCHLRNALSRRRESRDARPTKAQPTRVASGAPSLLHVVRFDQAAMLIRAHRHASQGRFE